MLKLLPDPDDYINRSAVCAYLGISPAHLRKLEQSGEGPPAVDLGPRGRGRRRMYRKPSVDDWLAARQAAIAPVATPETAVDALVPAKKPYRRRPLPAALRGALEAVYARGGADDAGIPFDLASAALEAAASLCYAALDWPNLPADDPGENPTECASKIQARIRQMVSAGIMHALNRRMQLSASRFVVSTEVVLLDQLTGAKVVLDSSFGAHGAAFYRQATDDAKDTGD